MKVRKLVFDSFKPYCETENDTLIFCKPASSKFYRVFGLPPHAQHGDVFDVLCDKGRVASGVFLFRMSAGQLLDDVVLPLVEIGIESVVLDVEPSFYN